MVLQHRCLSLIVIPVFLILLKVVLNTQFLTMVVDGIATQVVSNNQYVQLRGTASNIVGSTLTVGVSIGSAPSAATWKVISGQGVDTLPDVISFSNLINQIPGTVNVASNVQTISGVTAGIPLDVILTGELTTIRNC